MPPQKRRRVDITDASGLDKAACARAALEALAEPELEELSIDRRGIGPDACCALAAALNEEDAGEFPLVVAAPRSSLDCEACGCFYQLGTGHAREAARLRDGDERRCPRCGDDLVVRLRN